MGRDGSQLPRERLEMVSIHAPAWGATPDSQEHRGADGSFNPRARVGRDVASVMVYQILIGFNPRARVGRDAPRGLWHRGQGVSIHAPAWGATDL